MKLRGYMLLAAGLVFGGALFSQVQKNNPTDAPAAETEKKPVDIIAAFMYSDRELLRSHGIEEGARILVGDVAFHNNGAVISCDSAISYSNSRIEFFQNVIINKDSTFVYGDRAEFNGEQNLARVYSPVIKVVDGDAVLYTYNFTFDTRENVGRWFGGGVVYQEDNTMESEMGWFYSDDHELVAVRGVEMKNDTHELISDSVRYNTETKVAHFYTRTYIWTNEGEIISALGGRYDTRDSTYFFHDRAYILDEFRETWADTIDYRARAKDAILYGNVQIDDNEHDSSAFGDLAHYWGERGETRLTRRPSLLNYDAEQGNSDTLYMRADTIFMFVIYPSDTQRVDSLGRVLGEPDDPNAHLHWVDSLADSVRVHIADSLAAVIAPLRERIRELNRRADSIMNLLSPPPAEPALPPAPLDTLPARDSLPFAAILPPEADSVTSAPLAPEPEPEILAPPEVVELRLSAEELSVTADSLAAAERYIRPRSATPSSAGAADSLARLRLDSIAQADSLVLVDSLRQFQPKQYKALQKAEARRLKSERARLAAEAREAKLLEKQRLKAEKRAARAAEKAASLAARRRSVKRKGSSADSVARVDSVALVDSIRRLDSLLPPADTLAVVDSLPPSDSTTAESDTTLRIFRGWRNVKLWRTDMQAVADSMVGFSVDSTLHMYLGPIMWHAESQITADSIVLYTARQQIDHAEFFGDPIMASQIGGATSRQFNQVKGREMSSWFENGELRRHDTRGNAQALYYMQEEEEDVDGSTVMSDALAFLPLTAANMSFLFEADSLRYIIARENPDYDVLPIEQIPGTQPTQLAGFSWTPERKPTLGDVFDRQVRPTEREFYETLARPDFPVAARIDRRREYLIQNRMWADRIDPLPAYAIEFRERYFTGEE